MIVGKDRKRLGKDREIGITGSHDDDDCLQLKSQARVDKAKGG